MSWAAVRAHRLNVAQCHLVSSITFHLRRLVQWPALCESLAIANGAAAAESRACGALSEACHGRGEHIFLAVHFILPAIPETIMIHRREWSRRRSLASRLVGRARFGLLQSCLIGHWGRSLRVNLQSIYLFLYLRALYARKADFAWSTWPAARRRSALTARAAPSWKPTTSIVLFSCSVRSTRHRRAEP